MQNGAHLLEFVILFVCSFAKRKTSPSGLPCPESPFVVCRNRGQLTLPDTHKYSTNFSVPNPSNMAHATNRKKLTILLLGTHFFPRSFSHLMWGRFFGIFFNIPESATHHFLTRLKSTASCFDCALFLVVFVFCLYWGFASAIRVWPSGNIIPE